MEDGTAVVVEMRRWMTPFILFISRTDEHNPEG
jgi:hypothetical protein